MRTELRTTFCVPLVYRCQRGSVRFGYQVSAISQWSRLTSILQTLGLLPLPNLSLLSNHGLCLGVELGVLVVPVRNGHYQCVWLLIQHVRMIPLNRPKFVDAGWQLLAASCLWRQAEVGKKWTLMFG